MCKAVFITARLSSTRLPRKHLLKIHNRCCLEYVIEHAKLIKQAEKIILCTTKLSEDDVLVELASKHKILTYRGSVLDKIDRWYSAAKVHDIDFFVTADGDDLFCEPELMDMAFEQYDRTKADFINWETTGIVCGAFTYGIKVEALRKVFETKKTTDTEMMWHFFENQGFKTEPLQNIPDVYKRPEIRATLDYEEDYEFFKKTIDMAKKMGYNVLSMRNVLEVLDKNPDLVLINQFRHTDWKKNQENRVKEIQDEI
jgi:spore coat polysaccharide biosynthesis protein SpsF